MRLEMPQFTPSESAELITRLVTAAQRAVEQGRIADAHVLEQARLHIFALDLKLYLAQRACFDVPVLCTTEEEQAGRDRTRSLLFDRITQLIHTEGLIREDSAVLA
jgi:hypothetical protein